MGQMQGKVAPAMLAHRQAALTPQMAHQNLIRRTDLMWPLIGVSRRLQCPALRRGAFLVRNHIRSAITATDIEYGP